MLKIYNTLTRAKEEFTPIAAPRVGMYVCGMTVYDHPHIGNARAMVAFDVAQRWLRACGYEVTYVRNVTDIDDKIIRRAAESGEAPGALAERFRRAMEEDFAALGIQKPDLEPRATQHVDDMQALIGALERRGLAYQAQDGDVCFPVRKFPGYGRLSGKSLDELRAGERVEVDAGKRDPLDFVLWKCAKAGEPSWRSPWGEGRPGWHIECSAMSMKLLGEHFDIHGGGQDLQFPHHENEIAQSEGALADGRPFVRYWMHNAFVRMDEEKMSKSLGNVVTLPQALARHDGEALRFFFARAHYRSPLSYTERNVEDARQALATLYTALKTARSEAAAPDWSEPHGARFRAAMDDDFNTPEAVAVLFDLATEVNRSRDAVLARQLRALGGVLGLLGRDASAFLQGAPASEVGISSAEIEGLIAARNAARAAKNYAESDRIRKSLGERGIVLEDGPGGTTWRRG
ncbi:MAG TPA: cysteine--tRNA ligase [Casimicrobiaceae bacterium]|nr:cysteine--tRNA ligase [Casimicrobiaceae bacterium]